LRVLTLNKVNESFKSLFDGDTDRARKFAEATTWDFKIDYIIDRLHDKNNTCG